MKVKNPNPFITFCQKTIPLAFDESMSFMEAIYAFRYYLENNVVPAINSNAEAVVELTKLYEEIRDFVDNYFDNLDVQEEINNKLNAMVEAGTLQEIIADYLNSKAVFGFDTVADMQSATNFVDGSYAKTLGFYSKNDEGGATYKIREITNNDVIDGITIIKITGDPDNNLIAELIIENTMSVKQFGAKGDGSTDDTSFIQKTLDNVKNPYINDGTYMIDATTSLKPSSNQKITLSKNSVIKAIPNDETTYSIILIKNVNNVYISGGTIVGDKDTHTSSSGEWGHCIKIEDESTDITIENINLTKGWGDGVYVGESSNVTIINCHIYENRRQGISITYCDSFKIINNTIENTSGTNPQSGIDIEPNANDLVKNGIIESNIIMNNTGDGIDIVDNYYLTSPHVENITITSNIIKGNKINILLSGVSDTIITNNTLANTVQHIIAGTHINNTLIEHNNFKDSGSANIYLEYSNDNIILGNEILGQKTTSVNHSLNLMRSSNNLIKGNIITNSRRSGISLTGDNTGEATTQNINNIIDSNKIYNNSLNTNNSDNNIVLTYYAKGNVISNNNMLGSTTCKYNIFANDSLAGGDNIFMNNIMNNQSTGSIYGRSNKMLNNITDLVLSPGNFS